mgnify:FL=1
MGNLGVGEVVANLLGLHGIAVSQMPLEVVECVAAVVQFSLDDGRPSRVRPLRVIVGVFRGIPDQL